MNLDLKIELSELPECPVEGCRGVLLPFEDNLQGTSVMFTKGWCCSCCDHNIIMKSGIFERVAVKSLGVGK